jgi:hypothetical protein
MMSKPRPKLHSVRSPQREALATAIAEHEQAKAWFAHVKKATAANFEKSIVAHRVLDAAHLEIEKAENSAGQHAVAVALGQDTGSLPKSLKDAQADAQAAQAEYDGIQSVREGLNKELIDAQEAMRVTEWQLQRAVIAVVSGDGAVARVSQEYNLTLTKLVALRQALNYLDSIQALPSEVDLNVPPMLAERQTFVFEQLQRWAGLHGEARWRKYVEALAQDADALLS